MPVIVLEKVRMGLCPTAEYGFKLLLDFSLLRYHHSRSFEIFLCITFAYIRRPSCKLSVGDFVRGRDQDHLFQKITRTS